MAFEDKVKELAERRKQAEAMGGPEKLKRRKNAGVLNATERVDYLFDKNTFREAGLFGTSYLPDMKDQTPRDGKLCGFGQVDGRKVGVVAYDFTVKGSSSSYTNNKKMSHIKDTGAKRGIPVVFIGESTGVRMPDIMGEGMGFTAEGTRFLRRRKAPWVSAQLGMCFGSSAWHAVCSDFNVMRKGSVMAVASPRMVSKAVGHEVTGEALGGWRIHANQTGFADAVADTDEEAIDIVKTFLSYLPSHQNETPPERPVPKGSGEACKNLLDMMPESLAQTYDVREIIKAVADNDSFFEIKARFGSSITTALARIDGKSVGFIANNPQFKGGCMDAQSCEKVTSFVVLCDSYNIPLVFLQDQPGFLIGPDIEKTGIIGKVINWMNAMLQATVPKICIILRKSYGRGFINMGAGGTTDEVSAWFTAEVSFMDPRSAVSVVYGEDIEKEDPEKYQEHLAEMARDSSAYGLASVYGAKEVLDPRETREYLIDALDTHRNNLTGGIGEHLLEAWPTSYV
ncbi:MAG TPA: methylmalonyl-CoA carboxyltransferase [Rhodospirillaceae bacterium]|nr:methylmalonyl-CoA carboxyltransferase [Rhodospirillaceae bacterium]HAT34599.1 methylmalonyl-CoA carboxyltransferase [Rhodospirillaceae bacterium]